jgi:anti-sigma factor ChrR (cupin superfamily)
MLRCKEVTRLVASEAIRTAPSMTRIGVRVHLTLCRHCRRYVRELARIGAAVRHLYRDTPEQSERQEAMIRRILDRSGRPPG